jgi:hypothetical protein
LIVPAGSKHKINASWSAQVRCSTPRGTTTHSGLQAYDAILKLDAEPAAPDHEKLILLLVIVPREFALNFHKLDLLAVQSRDGLRTPMFGEQREFLV